MTLNARFILKCAVDGTLDVRVRTLWLSNSTIRIGVAREGGGGVGQRAQPPPRGRLMRCFSAVAELLVVIPLYSYCHFTEYFKNKPDCHLRVYCGLVFFFKKLQPCLVTTCICSQWHLANITFIFAFVMRSSGRLEHLENMYLFKIAY